MHSWLGFGSNNMQVKINLQINILCILQVEKSVNPY